MPQRFIAGAICPQCGEMDKLLVDMDAGSCKCVRCGYSDNCPADSEATTKQQVSIVNTTRLGG